MTNPARLACVIALLGGWSCRSSPTMPSGPMTFSGRIIDYATGASVPNVSLRIGDEAVVAGATGTYTATVPVGTYKVSIDGQPKSTGIDVRGPWTRGDFLVNGGSCRARYGQITDSFSGRPIAGAMVALNTRMVTDADGWYRQDGGCLNCSPCNTTDIAVSAKGYVSKSLLLGRGYSDVLRLDIPLDRGRDAK
jgi:hypothetical protein